MSQRQIDEEALADAYIERIAKAARSPLTMSESIKTASDQRRGNVVGALQGIARDIASLPATSQAKVKAKLGTKFGVGNNVEYILKESSAVAMVGVGAYWAAFFGALGI